MISLLLAIIYISFISLGLPDGLLGAAWPTMCLEMDVPVSYAGLISITIACGTIVSSLLSDRLTLRFGTGKIMVVSVAMTALALLGFSVTKNYWLLFIWAVPYGLGAGSVHRHSWCSSRSGVYRSSYRRLWLPHSSSCRRRSRRLHHR